MKKAPAVREVEKKSKTKSLVAKKFGISLITLSTYLKNNKKKVFIKLARLVNKE